MDPEHSARMDALTREPIVIVPFDPTWTERFLRIREKLERVLPQDLILRIEHIGSTAIPGSWAKPVVDVQVEVTSLDRVRKDVVPIMRDLGYEYIWRPTMGEQAPFYAWFILRDQQGRRVEHVHMVEPDEASRDRVLFRDFLCAHPDHVRRYQELKEALLRDHADDRVAYTQGKTDFVREVLDLARRS